MVYEYLVFDNFLSLAIGAFIIVFTILFYIVSKRLNRGTAFLISLVVAFIASWNLYNKRFYGEEAILAVFLYLAVGAILLRILWTFVKSIGKGFKK